MADKTPDTEAGYNINDRFGKRDGGPYADQVELVNAETRRAAVEGRKPDYDNLQPTAGVPVVSEAGLRAAAGLVGAPGKVEDLTAIAQVPVYVPSLPEVPKTDKNSTDEEKQNAAIVDAQNKALEADAPVKDSLDVTKAEVGQE